MPKDRTIHNVCEVCGKDFWTSREGARTCSNACRQRRKYFRKLNAKDAKHAMLTICILRRAATMRTDPKAAQWLAEIKDALDKELNTLRQHQIALPPPLPLLATNQKECENDNATLRGLRQAM